jgi:hypothetical protein
MFSHFNSPPWKSFRSELDTDRLTTRMTWAFDEFECEPIMG